MPVSDDLSPRNFVTKITKYERVVDIPNSNTILYDLLPAGIAMAEAKLTGVFNFTNPGAISHNEVLTLYKEFVDPNFAWKNFSLEEQAKVIKAGRSNCELVRSTPNCPISLSCCSHFFHFPTQPFTLSYFHLAYIILSLFNPILLF